MSYEFYKVLHLLGIFLVILALGGISLHVINGGNREFKARKFIAAIHGIGLVIVLVAGFGLLARLGLMKTFPAWAIGKLVIWLILGAIPAVYYRKPALGKPLWFLTWILAGAAAFLAIYKPMA